MRILFMILGIICALLGLVLSILPLGPIAFIPILLAFIFGILGYRSFDVENKGRIVGKLIFIISIVALLLSIYRVVFEENVVSDDIESIEKEKKSEEEAIKELEDIEIDE